MGNGEGRTGEGKVDTQLKFAVTFGKFFLTPSLTPSSLIFVSIVVKDVTKSPKSGFNIFRTVTRAASK